MRFVDRKDEIKRLRDAISASNPGLVIIYGRRRLGKSTLIKHILTNSDIYFMADRSEAPHQRQLLADVISRTFPEFNRVSYPDWESLLRQLNLRATGRSTLCLDEFPYLAEQSAELPSVIQKLTDEASLKYNIILCGSSQQMMYNVSLDSASPLYGRAAAIIKLTPIALPYLQEALGVNNIEAIEEYAVWGGVPRYWELRENSSSLREAIMRNVLSVNGTLYEEPAQLFRDDIRDIVKTATIMSYIGAGANRLSEIAARCNEPATNLSRPLKKLIDLGYIYREVPFGIDEKNSKKSLYRIADPFLSFYYTFVVPNKSFIELGRRAPIDLALTDRLASYVGMHWENICRQAVCGNVINGKIYGQASRWWGSVINAQGEPEAVEFDVVAESLDSSSLLVGECKWTETADPERLLAELMRKAQCLSFAKGKTIVPKLFLKKCNNPTPCVLLPEEVIQLSRCES